MTQRLIFFKTPDGKSIKKEVKRATTFRDGVLNFCAFKNNVMVVKTFFFFNEVIGVAVFSTGTVVGGGTWRELDLGNENPL